MYENLGYHERPFILTFKMASDEIMSPNMIGRKQLTSKMQRINDMTLQFSTRFFLNKSYRSSKKKHSDVCFLCK